MQDLAGLLLHEQGLASRFEGSEVFGIKVGDSGSVAVVRTDPVSEARPSPHACEIRLPVCSAWDGLANGNGLTPSGRRHNYEEGKPQQHGQTNLSHIELRRCCRLLRDNVLGGAGKYFAAIRKGDVTSRRVIVAVLCAKAFDLDRMAWLQHIPGNSTPHQHARRAT